MAINKIIDQIKVIECPRDAMQGILDFIPTSAKIAYINDLLKVGFHTLDCGSFVSPKAIPQMRDTAEVLDQLDMDNTNSKLSVIVANERGARDAVQFKQVSYLGYPFSISEEFQQRNTRKSIADSLDLVKSMLDIASENDKEIILYISMGFGNPYGEEWSEAIVQDWVGKLCDIGISSFSISDTVGVSNKDSISRVFSSLIPAFTNAEFGAHFHTKIGEWEEKIDTAFINGCKRFDGAIKGYGGCPMAKDDLVGNMPTEKLIEYFGYEKLQLKKAPFEEAFLNSNSVFVH